MTNTKKKILLIDDDPNVCSSLMMLLKDEFDAHAAATVREGVQMFDSLHPSVVILDLHLPDQHGLDALRSIRRIDRVAPVMILTGFATLETIEESMRLGASDCMHKPFDASDLVSRLRELVTDSRELEKADSFGTVADFPSELGEATTGEMVSSAFLHDVSNPLTSLSAISAMLRDGAGDTQKRERLLDMVEQNVAYMGSLLEQWRAFSEPETLREDFGTLEEIVFQSSELVKLRAEARGVTIALDVKNADACPKLNRHAVARILVNLLQNSIEAVKRSEGKIEFNARSLSDGMVEFSVTDNGVGIAPQSTHEIFQPRYTTKKKGKGLGLYIARRIVESAKGSISICSRLGRGTTFKVQLPSC